MQSLVVGIRGKVQTDLIDMVQEIDIGKAVFRGVIHHLLIPFVIPVRIEAGGLNKDQLHTFLLAEEPDLVQILIAYVSKLVVGQLLGFRQGFYRPHIRPHQETIVAEGILMEEIAEVRSCQLAPAAMVAEEGENIAQKGFILHLRGQHRLDFVHREGQIIQGHTVIGFALGLAVLHGQHVEYNHLRRLPLQGVLEGIVGMPDQLLGAAPDVAGDSVILPQGNGGEILVHLAVPHKNDVVLGGFLIILPYQSAVGDAVHILRHQQGLEKEEGAHPYKGNPSPFEDTFHGCSLSELIVNKLAGVIAHAVGAKYQHRKGQAKGHGISRRRRRTLQLLPDAAPALPEADPQH